MFRKQWNMGNDSVSITLPPWWISFTRHLAAFPKSFDQEQFWSPCCHKGPWERKTRNLGANMSSGQMKSRPHTTDFPPKWWWKVREMGPLISGKSRLVKYYDLARWVGSWQDSDAQMLPPMSLTWLPGKAVLSKHRRTIALHNIPKTKWYNINMILWSYDIYQVYIIMIVQCNNIYYNIIIL